LQLKGKRRLAEMGMEHDVEIVGLDHEIQQTRASLTEVMLYLPYSYVIMPAK
jgi:hypothetical protein